MDNNLLALILVLLLTAAIIGALVVWSNRRVDKLLQAWAQQKGYTIVAKKRQRFAKTPFGFGAGRYTDIFHVTVQDRHGKRREGWVRFGVIGSQMNPDRVDAQWDSDTG